MKVDVKNLDAGTVGQIDLVEDIFAREIRADILHRVVTWQLAKRRATARAAKERGDVKLTSKKMYRQKGSGSARHGNKAAPQFRKGGKAHGPRARDFEFSLNKKIRALGLKVALSAKQAEGKLIVLENLEIADGKTKVLAEKLGKLGINSGLFIDGEAVDANFKLAASNLPKINALPVIGANVYDILKHDTLVLTKAAVEKLEARFNG